MASNGLLVGQDEECLCAGDFVRVTAYFNVMLVRGAEDGVARPEVNLCFDEVVVLQKAVRMSEVSSPTSQSPLSSSLVLDQFGLRVANISSVYSGTEAPSVFADREF